MDVVVQWVRTSWSKTSRGGPAAARRNAVPVGFELPNVPAPFIHEVTMREDDDFAPRATITSGLPTEDVLLSELDGRLRVALTPTPFGMPRRWRRPPAVHLGSGEWVRWQINFRFAGTGTGEWSYRLDTLNLAYGTVSPDRFLQAPTRYVDELAYLR